MRRVIVTALAFGMALAGARGRANEDDWTALGRGVAVVSPGDYEISSVALPPGVTLSARGARFHRPALSGADVVTLRIEHGGAADSALSLLEGLVIDGRRDEQGAYRDHERENAHLVALSGDGVEGAETLETDHVVILNDQPQNNSLVLN